MGALRADKPLLENEGSCAIRDTEPSEGLGAKQGPAGGDRSRTSAQTGFHHVPVARECASLQNESGGGLKAEIRYVPTLEDG